ncbi:Hypothetical predicted protein [Pelobates cultripes]|uniref:Uncharacterized protein n=1 Tax=Pelobates cultripes TaxID=61616 RepID=A0AAD1TK43_PELCU|nr:Hypothetical predicted protein [Pelobates cultripes]
MRRPGDERGTGSRGRERRRYRSGPRVTWDVIRGPQELIMGRRVDRGPQELPGSSGDISGSQDVFMGHREEGEDDAQGSFNMAPQDMIMGEDKSLKNGEQGSKDQVRDHREGTAPRGHGDPGDSEEYECKGGLQKEFSEVELENLGRDSQKRKIRHKEKIEGSQRHVGCSPKAKGTSCRDPDRCYHEMKRGDQVEESVEENGESCHKALCSVKCEKLLSLSSQQNIQKMPGSQDMYREYSDGEAQGDLNCGPQESSSVSSTDISQQEEENGLLDLYRGGDEDTVQTTDEKGLRLEGRSPDNVGSHDIELVNAKGLMQGFSGLGKSGLVDNHIGTLEVCDKESARMFFLKEKSDIQEAIKGSTHEVLAERDSKERSDVVGCYGERSPGNGSSGSAEWIDLEKSHNIHGAMGKPFRTDSGGVDEWDGSWGEEMEDKRSNNLNHEHADYGVSSKLNQNQSCIEGALDDGNQGKLEEGGTWCWCLQLYLGQAGASEHCESNLVAGMKSPESGYSLNSTLRVGEGPGSCSEEEGADSLSRVHVLPIKKTSRIAETPELQEWVNWWQGWAGSCRSGPGHRRGKGTAVWGCREEARGEGQKPQDVWVMREWTSRESGRRNGREQGISGGDVWVLREQEVDRRGAGWPLGEQDVWVPRDTRKLRGSPLIAGNIKWTPQSSKPGFLDKGEP